MGDRARRTGDRGAVRRPDTRPRGRRPLARRRRRLRDPVDDVLARVRRHGRLTLGSATLAGMHLVFALDLSLMAPSMAIGGVWLWRRKPWGYVLATALCVFGAAYQANLAAAGAFQTNAGVDGAKLVDPMGAAVLLAFVVAAMAMLRRVR